MHLKLQQTFISVTGYFYLIFLICFQIGVRQISNSSPGNTLQMVECSKFFFVFFPSTRLYLFNVKAATIVIGKLMLHNRTWLYNLYTHVNDPELRRLVCCLSEIGANFSSVTHQGHKNFMQIKDKPTNIQPASIINSVSF